MKRMGSGVAMAVGATTRTPIGKCRRRFDHPPGSHAQGPAARFDQAVGELHHGLASQLLAGAMGASVPSLPPSAF